MSPMCKRFQTKHSFENCQKEITVYETALCLDQMKIKVKVESLNTARCCMRFRELPSIISYQGS